MYVPRPPTRASHKDHVRTVEDGQGAVELVAGDGRLWATLPAEARVIAPRRPLLALVDPEASVRHALAQPTGDAPPLSARVRAGQRVVIVLAAPTGPAPRRTGGDPHALATRAVLAELAAAGVVEVELVLARGLGRAPGPAELARRFGPALAERLRIHDADAARQAVGTTVAGEVVELPAAIAGADLVVAIDVDGAPRAAGPDALDGLGGPGDAMAVVEDPDPAAARARRRAVLDAAVPIFCVRLVLARAEVEASSLAAAGRWVSAHLGWPRPRAAEAAPCACFAGDRRAVEEAAARRIRDQHVVEVAGQADVVVAGLPAASPWAAPEAPADPLAVEAMAMALARSPARGQPLLRDGGVLVIAHPLPAAFDAAHAPAAVFHRARAAVGDDPRALAAARDALVSDEVHRRAYREAGAIHGAAPWLRWRADAEVRRRLDAVIVVGARDAAVAAELGWQAAPTVADALALATTRLGATPRIAALATPTAPAVEVVR
ncbi:MAG: lactate racemase domain-containing protein [Kofleriaceae bacterium]